MKKLLPILVVLAIVACCYQIIVTFFISEHQVNYSLIASDQQTYTISENYQKKGKRHYYSFLIDSKKNNFSVKVEEDFDKQDRVITDIKYYKKDKLECIFPIYKRNHTYDVSCSLDGLQVTPFYLRQAKNEDFQFIIKKFEKDYDKKYYQDGKITKEKNLGIYYDNIPEDFIFAVWNYRGIDIVTSEGLEEKQFLNEDHYENDLSTVVGKYYVTVNTDEEEERLKYYQIIVYNLQDGGKTVVDVDLSQNSYFNGSSNGKLYITDPKEKKQYVFNPAKKEVTEVTKVKEVKNSKLVKAGNDFFDNPKVDSNMVINKQITKLYGTTDIKRSGDDYYFKTNDGKLYRVIQKDYKHPILLCQFSDMKEWQAHDDGVSFIVKDTLYFYNDVYGFHPILVNLEFNYNSKNIYHFIRGE